MKISLRPYAQSEFEKSAEIREISSPESRADWKHRVEKSGLWVDHFLHLAIDRDGILVGDLQIRHCSQSMPDGVIEIGIDIAEDERGKGIGTQTLILATEKFLGEDFHRMSGSTSVDNLAMIRAFQKAGWSYEGRLKSLFRSEEGYKDYESFSKTRS